MVRQETPAAKPCDAPEVLLRTGRSAKREAGETRDRDMQPCGGTSEDGLALGCGECAFVDSSAGAMFASLVDAELLGGCYTLATARQADEKGTWSTAGFFSSMMDELPTACFTPPETGGFRCYSNRYFGKCD